MPAATDALLQIDVLHNAIDYIPKKALRYFMELENRAEAVSVLLEEAQDVVQHPEEYIQEGSQFLFYALLILGSFREEKAIPLIRQIGTMDIDAIDEMLGDRLFDSISLAVAEIFDGQIEELKNLLEDSGMDPCVRATCAQAMLLLYGRGALSRDEIVAYFVSLLKNPENGLPFLYEVIASSAIALYPEEMIDLLREFYQDERIDPSHIQLEEIEECLALPKEEAISEFRITLDVHLDDPVTHLETIDEIQQAIGYDRNDPCPCGSGFKFKKCCQ